MRARDDDEARSHLLTRTASAEAARVSGHMRISFDLLAGILRELAGASAAFRLTISPIASSLPRRAPQLHAALTKS